MFVYVCFSDSILYLGCVKRRSTLFFEPSYILHPSTNLSSDGRSVHTPVVLPPMQAAFCCHIRQVNISPGQQASVRETHYIFKFVSGAFAGYPIAAVGVYHQRDAAVPPCGGEVDVLGNEAAVRRRVGKEHDGQGG